MPTKLFCDSCGAPLRWHKARPTQKNPFPKANPLDVYPNQKGNISLFPNGEYEILTKQVLEKARAENKELFTSHFSTCPNAKQFRRK